MDCWHLVLQIYKLPQSSLAELARNSVRQSGFEMEIKRHWIGNYWYLPGAAGNDINKVHVCLSLFRFSQFTNDAHYGQCRQMFLISGSLTGTRRWWANLIWYAEKLKKGISLAIMGLGEICGVRTCAVIVLCCASYSTNSFLPLI